MLARKKAVVFGNNTADWEGGKYLFPGTAHTEKWEGNCFCRQCRWERREHFLGAVQTGRGNSPSGHGVDMRRETVLYE